MPKKGQPRKFQVIPGGRSSSLTKKQNVQPRKRNVKILSTRPLSSPTPKKKPREEKYVPLGKKSGAHGEVVFEKIKTKQKNTYFIAEKRLHKRFRPKTQEMFDLLKDLRQAGTSAKDLGYIALIQKGKDKLILMEDISENGKFELLDSRDMMGEQYTTDIVRVIGKDSAIMQKLGYQFGHDCWLIAKELKRTVLIDLGTIKKERLSIAKKADRVARFMAIFGYEPSLCRAYLNSYLRSGGEPRTLKHIIEFIENRRYNVAGSRLSKDMNATLEYVKRVETVLKKRKKKKN